MKRYQVGIIGYFANGVSKAGGQEAKTHNLTHAIEEKYSDSKILKIDTLNWNKKPFKFFLKCFAMMKNSEKIIIMPAQNGIQIFAYIFSMCKKIYAFKLFYSVIGGWLPELIENKKILFKCLKKFNGIWVETNSMKNKLNHQGLDNVYVVPNFKNLKILSEDELIYNLNPPYKLCTFSRVMREKGIEDAVNAITELNQEAGKIKFKLDIYGKVDPEYVECFQKMQQQFPEYISYCGIAEPDQSVSVIKEYDLLLFPTKFKTEGVPGTIIDSYCAGVPVLSSKWDSFSDIILEEKTGIGFELGNYEEFKSKIKLFFCKTEKNLAMKKNCIAEANKYIKEKNIEILQEYMEC